MMRKAASGVGVMIVAASLLFPSGCASGPKFDFDAPYEDFKGDLKLMRETTHNKAQNANVNTTEAVEAAQRVFEYIPFVGMTRAEVVDALGDPETVNDYGVAMAAGDNAPLTYWFHDGQGGVRYTILFQDGKAYDMTQEFTN